MPEVVLQGARVVAIIGQLEPTGMAKHVRVDREWHLGGLAEALDEPVVRPYLRAQSIRRSTSRSVR